MGYLFSVQPYKVEEISWARPCWYHTQILWNVTPIFLLLNFLTNIYLVNLFFFSMLCSHNFLRFITIRSDTILNLNPLTNFFSLKFYENSFDWIRIIASKSLNMRGFNTFEKFFISWIVCFMASIVIGSFLFYCFQVY